MKKIFLISFLMVLLISFVSAEFLSIKNDIAFTKEESIIIGTEQIEYKTLWEEYSPIEIKDILGLGNILFKGAITKHTESCGNEINCLSELTIEIPYESVLIEDLLFYKIDESKRELTNINFYQLQYYGLINDYKSECTEGDKLTAKNGTVYFEQLCKETKIGSHYGWIDYKIGTKLPAGTYYIKLIGGKKSYLSIDWVIKTQGKEIPEWATWGNISTGSQAEVVLITPNNGSIQYSNPVNLTARLNITGGANTVNMSIYDNFGGTWGLRESTVAGAGVSTTNNQPQAPTNTFPSITTKSGMKFATNDNVYLSYINVTNSVTATKAYLWNASKDLLATADVTNFKAIFNYVLTAGTYYVVVDKEGLQYTDNYKNGGASYPQIGTTINWTGCYFQGGDNNAYTDNIESITTSTIVSATINSYYRNYTGGSNIIWNVQGCDSEGACGFSPNNYTFTMDSTAPILNYLNGNGTQDYGTLNINHTLNYNLTDVSLQNCSLEYNSINRTIPCTSGSLNKTNFTLSSGVYLAKIYATDSIGNLLSYPFTWTYKVFENNRTHNITSYETASESFNVNVTANSSLTAIKLVYNGTEYPLTYSSGLWSLSKDISQVGNNTIQFKFTYAGNDITSNYTSYQNIIPITFQLCNSTITTKYLNISFRDETTSNAMNATIPSSTFTYYLGTGTANKTYTFTNTTANYEYDLCFSPVNRTLNIVPYVQFANTGYPQRVWSPLVSAYSNTLASQILYLLSSADGIYVTYQVLNGAGEALSGVGVIVNKTVGSTQVPISTGTTGSDGGVTFWLNPDFVHTLTFSKEGYTDYIFSQTPTQSLYTITLGTVASNVTSNYRREIIETIKPTSNFLNKNTTYSFNYTISSTYWTLDSWGFVLKYSNGTVIGTESSSENTGGTLNLVAGTSESPKIIMSYYYIVNGTYQNSTRYWATQTPNDFSITNFFEDLSTYIDGNLLGINGTDGDGSFSKGLIAVLILVFSAGFLSYRYGISSEPAIMGIVFGIVLFLNNIGFLPTSHLNGTSGLALGDLAVVITAIIMIGFIVKEEQR